MGAASRIEVHKDRRTICMWGMWEGKEWSGDYYSPWASQETPESSILFQCRHDIRGLPFAPQHIAYKVKLHIVHDRHRGRWQRPTFGSQGSSSNGSRHEGHRDRTAASPSSEHVSDSPSAPHASAAASGEKREDPICVGFEEDMDGVVVMEPDPEVLELDDVDEDAHRDAASAAHRS